jgi:hypothetical protein
MTTRTRCARSSRQTRLACCQAGYAFRSPFLPMPAGDHGGQGYGPGCAPGVAPQQPDSLTAAGMRHGSMVSEWTDRPARRVGAKPCRGPHWARSSGPVVRREGLRLRRAGAGTARIADSVAVCLDVFRRGVELTDAILPVGFVLSARSGKSANRCRKERNVPWRCHDAVLSRRTASTSPVPAHPTTARCDRSKTTRR